MATGTSTLSSQRAGQRGFTLFEILVVVIIVIVTVSAVVFSTSIGRGDKDLEMLGSDLGKLVQLLYQEAIFENRNYAISLDDKGYQVLEYDGEKWNVSGQTFFRKVKLEEIHQSTLIVDEKEVEAIDAEADEVIPHILILSSGEMSAFEWQIVDESLESKITLQGDLLGNILVLGPVSLNDV